MKNKLCSTLIILCIVGVIFGCAKQTNEPEPEFEPTPLVIENDKWTPQGMFYGTIVLEGAETDGSYEGPIYVTIDGKYIRITCTDAVRSRFGEEF